MDSFMKFLILAALTFGSCTKKKSELVWDVNLPIIGSQSSPRAVDLNGDGILDIVMGAGKNEFQKSEQGILAFNGKDGQILWQHEARDQVYGAATFYDINGDGIQDVFIGGRSPHLKALDGKTGGLLWEYQVEADDPILEYARFNFYNIVLIEDQNQDGFPELLTANGGNAEADPHSEINRYPGVLMLLDARTGNVIAADTMPDGKETYMAPLGFQQPDSQDYHLIFGTGGETIGGGLYTITLSEFRRSGLGRAKTIASDDAHGFIAPPVLADITGDGWLDIVVISHGSKIFALDGNNHELIWQQEIPDTESSNSFAAGYFTDDEVPDFFTFVSKGVWPNNTGSLQVMLGGKDGKIVYKDSLGCTGFSSPVVYDLNNDGYDEAVISINEFDCYRDLADRSPFKIVNKLVAVDFKNRSTQIIDQTAGFKNIFSTPWMGDMDGDGFLDLVHLQYYSHSDMLSFLGMRIKRISTSVKVRKPVIWGAFMGSDGDGIFKDEK